MSYDLHARGRKQSDDGLPVNLVDGGAAGLVGSAPVLCSLSLYPLERPPTCDFARVKPRSQLDRGCVRCHQWPGCAIRITSTRYACTIERHQKYSTQQRCPGSEPIAKVAASIINIGFFHIVLDLAGSIRQLISAITVLFLDSVRSFWRSTCRYIDCGANFIHSRRLIEVKMVTKNDKLPDLPFSVFPCRPSNDIGRAHRLAADDRSYPTATPQRVPSACHEPR